MTFRTRELIDGLLWTGATVMVATAGEAFAITAPPDDRPAGNAIDYRAMDWQAAVALAGPGRHFPIAHRSRVGTLVGMPAATLKILTLHSSNARRDATFWSAVLGLGRGPRVGRVRHAHRPRRRRPRVRDGRRLRGAGLAEPQGSKQFHLDLAVEEIDAGVTRCVELGASLAEPEPGETWRVLRDRSGHPSASRSPPTGADGQAASRNGGYVSVTRAKA